MAEASEKATVYQRIISYSVHYNGFSQPRVIYSGSLALASTVPEGEHLNAASLYDYIRKTAISAAKDARPADFGSEDEALFSVVITQHFTV